MKSYPAQRAHAARTRDQARTDFAIQGDGNPWATRDGEDTNLVGAFRICLCIH